jgi:putative FmdB family regulatory protein
MPRYDYRCSDCGNLYEKREGFDAPATQACPQCAGTARRVLTPPAIVFKGSGWYVTDHRKGVDSSSTSGNSATTATKGEGAAATTESSSKETASKESSKDSSKSESATSS